MSKSIVEMHQYFKERPELWAKLSGGMSDGYGYKIEQCRDSVGAWAKYSVKARDFENVRSLISSSIMDAFSRLEEEEEVERAAGEEFKRWYSGEWQEERVICYKGFNKDLTCRDFQYEIGKEYEIEEPICMCECGFHACKDPLAVLDFYRGIDKRYCIVEQWGYMDAELDKSTSSNIKIVKEISLRELFETAAETIEKGMPLKASSVRDGDWEDISSLPDMESMEGYYDNVILRQDFGQSQVTGALNVIGIMRNRSMNYISGDNNKAYVFGDGNSVSVQGSSNIVNVIEGERNTVVVSGCNNKIRVNGKSHIICVGNANSVIAGIGSTITFDDEKETVSVVVDGEQITPDMEICFINGQIEELKLDNIS